MRPTHGVSLRDIEEAQDRIGRFLNRTPLEYSSELSGAHSTDVYLKLEVFQPIRVFKLRGALNKVLCLSGSSLRKGVITASSGNHGLAVAYVSRMFDVQSVICVPITSNPQKLSAIRECGARVVQSGSNYDEAFQTALSLARREGLTFIHAFDDPDVIAGQGTCGLEIAAQAQHIDFVFVPIGGGGLISGVATALKSILENVTVIGVQTAVVHSMYDSLKAGKRVTAIPRASIADGMMALTPGVHTFGLVRKYVDRIVLVSDNQMKSAIVELIRSARIMVEPAGAAPLAALKKQRPVDQGRVVLLVSGGNISQSLLGEVTCSDQIVSRTRRIRAQ